MLDEMQFNPVARSLISAKPAISGIASLRVVEDLGTINLRLITDEARIKAGKTLGLDVPTAANRFVVNGDYSLFWLGPNEWLLQAPDARIADLHAELEAALNGQRAAATVVSDHSVAIELTGSGARHVLEKGCPLDLHDRSFAEGHCAQSHYLQAVVILARTGPDRYLLRVRRSMGEYLWDALADAIAKGD